MSEISIKIETTRAQIMHDSKSVCELSSLDGQLITIRIIDDAKKEIVEAIAKVSHESLQEALKLIHIFGQGIEREQVDH